MTDIYALSDRAILEQVGKKLKEARVERNVSQRELAKASGLSMFSISQMENGHNTSLLSLVMVLRALNRLDVLEELFREKPLSPIALSDYMKKNPPRQRAYKIESESRLPMAAEPNFNWDE